MQRKRWGREETIPLPFILILARARSALTRCNANATRWESKDARQTSECAKVRDSNHISDPALPPVSTTVFLLEAERVLAKESINRRKSILAHTHPIQFSFLFSLPIYNKSCLDVEREARPSQEERASLVRPVLVFSSPLVVSIACSER